MTSVAGTAIHRPPVETRLRVVLVVSVAALPFTAWLAGVLGMSDNAATHFIRYPVWSALMAPAMVYAWGADYLLRPVVFRSANPAAGRLLGFTMALIPLAIWYGTIGLVAGNPLHYVAGDTFKYLLTPLGFYLAAVGVQSASEARWLLRALAVFGFWPGLDIGGHLLPLGYLYGRKAVYWKRYHWLLLLPVVYFTISVNRTSLLVVPVLTVALYYYARRFRVWHLGAFAVLVAAAGWALYRVAPDVVKGTGAFQKSVQMIEHLNVEDYRQLDASTYQRLQEAVLVRKKFAEASWLERAFGFGSGAVYRVSELPPSEQAFLEDVEGGYAHHIHLSPVFVYHQWGLPGTMLLAYSALALALVGWRLGRERREADEPGRQEQYALQLAAYFMALGFYLYSGWNPPKISLFYFGLLLGALWRLMGSRTDRMRGSRRQGGDAVAGVVQAAGDLRLRASD